MSRTSGLSGLSASARVSAARRSARLPAQRLTETAPGRCRVALGQSGLAVPAPWLCGPGCPTCRPCGFTFGTYVVPAAERSDTGADGAVAHESDDRGRCERRDDREAGRAGRPAHTEGVVGPCESERSGCAREGSD